MVVINVSGESGKIVFEDEGPEKFRIAKLHSDVPRHAHRHIEDDARDPESTQDCLPIALYGDEKKNDDRRQRRRDRPFGEGSKGKKNVESCKEAVPSAF